MKSLIKTQFAISGSATSFTTHDVRSFNTAHGTTACHA